MYFELGNNTGFKEWKNKEKKSQDVRQSKLSLTQTKSKEMITTFSLRKTGETLQYSEYDSYNIHLILLCTIVNLSRFGKKNKWS
ncbi:hypothetical protein ACSAZK_13875 [Methanosarcina sp. Mfa9]|uniref:hypothetical protein n=1 Tax=Methanosarcina sp. Mfa9 TaxID=3439063 RepID=UPI003F8616AD